jgi:hypothetical protein
MIAPSAAVPDWREIPVAPLGTELAALYSGLHEILYFRAAEPAGADPAGEPPDPGESAIARDCYRANGPVPRVLEHASRDYVLCFTHDRLARVEVVLSLPAAEARTLGQRFCDAWMPDSIATARSENSCGGRSGDAAFRLRWRGSESESGAALSIVVYAPEGTE